ncbi:MAG TPA: RNA 2',3'-cyclic phosphodiesterase [Fontimonas sp.]
MALELNRLFLALWPNAAVRDACSDAARSLRMRMQPSGRAIPPEQFHLTLTFLGNAVDAAAESRLRALLGQVRVSPFRLSLDYASCFRDGAHWWLGCRHSPPELATLHIQLRDAVHRAGITPDRARFVPHLTLQRDAGMLLPQTAVTPIGWDVESFTLARSRIDLPAPQYDQLEHWTLRAAETAAPAGGQMPLNF